MIGGWNNLTWGSFRGVPFRCEFAAGEYGRRWADHEYPGRDTPFAEDMGRAQRVWRFAGYVLGPARHIQRDLLLAACQAPGPGTLVHPTIPGAVRAVCRSVAFTEERERGNLVTFTFEFAEAGVMREPTGFANLDIGVESASDSLGAAIPLSFLGGPGA